MKNKIIKAITATLVLSLLFTACSTKDNKKKKDRDRNSRHERDEDDDDDDDDSNTYHEYVPAPDYLNGQPTWFENQGLRFTNNGNFQMYVRDGAGNVVTVPANMVIQTDYDCEEGYKNIVATTTIDVSSAPNFHFWTSSFDKYTGTSFEFHDDGNSLYNGCDIIRDGDVHVIIGEYDYYFHINEHIVMDDSITVITYTITCPEEYDGTVLQYGTNLEDNDTVHDFNAIWLADEFTDMHGDFNYFTLQGLPSQAH